MPSQRRHVATTLLEYFGNVVAQQYQQLLRKIAGALSLDNYTTFRTTVKPRVTYPGFLKVDARVDTQKLPKLRELR